MQTGQLKPLAIGSAVAAGAALVVFNVVALTLHTDYPWLPALDFVVDVAVIGAGILLLVRQGMLADVRQARTKAALDATQTRLATIVDSAMDAIITMDDAQNIVLFNRAAEAMFRCHREDVMGSPLEVLLPARYRHAHRAHVEKFGRTGETTRRMGGQTALWALRADTGEEFPIEASISHVTEGGRQFYTVVLRDITLRRSYEQEAQRRQDELQELSARVLEAREEEKTLIARELHDELGQLLTAAKMDVGWLRGRIAPADAELAAKSAGLDELLDRTIKSMRRISADLRPLMLDDLGLADAAAWLVDDFAERSGVDCRLELPRDGSLDALDKPVATTVYRVLQESLTNIGRHAQAGAAWVVLAVDPGGVRIDVEDDGRGFDSATLGRSRSLGLKGMRERVLYLGGTLEIGRAPRGGTRVSARIPARKAAA